MFEPQPHSAVAMTAPTTIYVGEPDIPAGMTIGEYRRSRAAHITWWQRMLRRRG
jgi:hypothetical protein